MVRLLMSGFSIVLRLLLLVNRFVPSFTVFHYHIGANPGTTTDRDFAVVYRKPALSVPWNFRRIPWYSDEGSEASAGRHRSTPGGNEEIAGEHRSCVWRRRSRRKGYSFDSQARAKSC
jgi:hypothetical protein